MGAQGAKQKCVAESRSVTHPCPFLVFKFIFEKLVPLQCLSNSLGRIFLCALGHMSSPARLHGRHTVRFLSKTIVLQLCLNIFLVVMLSLKIKFPNSEMSFQRSDGCTVVIQAYNKNRFELLQSILYPYETSEFVKHIIIKTNYSISNFAYQFANIRKLEILKTDVLSLNNRFAIPPKFKSACNIVADDDIFIEAQELFFIYQVWRNNQDKLVGPFVRLVSEESSIKRSQLNARNNTMKLVYQDSSGEYNIVLTKLMFLHQTFLDHYLSKSMKILRNVVDKFGNCEDIAINFSATMIHGSPLHVDVRPNDFGDSRNYGPRYAGIVAGGIGARHNHWNARQICSNEIYHIIRKLPLIKIESFAKFAGEHSLCWTGTEHVYCRNRP